jgi:hypothetical protein
MRQEYKAEAMPLFKRLMVHGNRKVRIAAKSQLAYLSKHEGYDDGG